MQQYMYIEMYIYIYTQYLVAGPRESNIHKLSDNIHTNNSFQFVLIAAMTFVCPTCFLSFFPECVAKGSRL